MKKVFVLLLSVMVFGLVSHSISDPREDEPLQAQANLIPEDSVEVAFHKMMDALTHPRCTNCHPANNKHMHLGGATNLGIENKDCSTCHQKTNNSYSGVPGAPDWAMAPPSMAWQGKSRYEIAEQMMDPERNGNRSADDIMHHLTEHELVLWAWEPGLRPDGSQRELPPVSKEEYIQAVKTWIAAGATIPEEK